MADDVEDDDYVGMDIDQHCCLVQLDASSVDSMVDSKDEQVIEVELVVDVHTVEVEEVVVLLVNSVVVFLVTNAVVVVAVADDVVDDAVADADGVVDDAVGDDVIDNSLVAEMMVVVVVVVVLVNNYCYHCPYVHCYCRNYSNDVVDNVYLNVF